MLIRLILADVIADTLIADDDITLIRGYTPLPYAAMIYS